MAPVQVIDLTGDASDNEMPSTTTRQKRDNATVHDHRKDNSEFWARIASGPRQHGPKRMRDIGKPRLGDTCPFLELPAEVRNRIYEHALGGHNLHMFICESAERQAGWRTKAHWTNIQTVWDHRYECERTVGDRHWLQYVPCQCPNSDDETYRMSTEIPEINKHGMPLGKKSKDGATPVSFSIESYLRRHQKCLDMDVLKYGKVGMRKLLTTPKLAMGLLRTCKQVYNEAALVPYYDNTFTFTRAADLDLFVKHVLLEKQRSALQNISYVLAHKKTRSKAICPSSLLKHHFSDERLLRGIESKTIDLLSGLKLLTITMDIDGETVGHAPALGDFPRFLSCPGLKVQFVHRQQEYHDQGAFTNARDRAEEFGYALVRSVAAVPHLREARKQLEYAQIQAEQLEHAKTGVALTQ